MPYADFHGIRFYYRSSGASKGFWIFWYVFWIGMSGLFILFSVANYFHERAILSPAKLEKTPFAGYDGLISGLIGAVFFGLFWLIPLIITIVKKLTHPSQRPYYTQPFDLNDVMRPRRGDVSCQSAKGSVAAKENQRASARAGRVV
jgi:hypothetical protein